MGRDTIAITGVATNVCCDSTARDGAMRDFKVLFLSDCNASFSQAEQEATLNNFDKHFGVVMDSQTLVGKLRRGKGWSIGVMECWNAGFRTIQHSITPVYAIVIWRLIVKRILRSFSL